MEGRLRAGGKRRSVYTDSGEPEENARPGAAWGESPKSIQVTPSSALTYGESPREPAAQGSGGP